MAPKGQKRVATDAKKTNVVKKARAEATEDSLMVSIVETIETAETLPQACRNMLITGVRASITTPFDERHEVQTTMMGMVDEVMNARDAILEGDVASAKEAVTTAEATKAQLVANLEKAEASLTEKTTLLEEKTSATNLAAERMVAANASLAEKEEFQKSGDAKMEQIQKNKAAVVNAIAVDVKQILAGESDGKELMVMLTELKFDDSLLTALPSTCARVVADRGEFDGMVLKQLETSLQQKLESLSKDVEAEVPLSKERSEAVAVAQEEASSATWLHSKNKDEQLSAEASRLEAAAAVDEASKSLVAHGPEEQNVVAQREEKIAALEGFQKNIRTPFEVLRDATSVAKTKAAELAETKVAEPAEAKLAEMKTDTNATVTVGGA